MGVFPDDPTGLSLAFAFDADLTADPDTWTFDADFSAEAQPEVVIRRGRIGEQNTVEPTDLEASVRNPDGEFSPRNAMGPHYGRFRRTVPVQAAVDVGAGPQVRGTSFVSDWPQVWTTEDADERVPLNALGVLSRLGQGRRSLSAAYRTHTAPSGLPPLAYWSLESDSGGTTPVLSFPADMAGVDPLIISIEPGVLAGGDEGPAGSKRLPVFVGTVDHAAGIPPVPHWFEAPVPASSPGSWSISVACKGTPASPSDQNQGWTLFNQLMGDGTRIDAIIFGGDWGGISGVVIAGTVTTALDDPHLNVFDSQWHEVAYSQEQSGGNIVHKVYFDGVLRDTETTVGTVSYPSRMNGPNTNTGSPTPVNIGSTLALGHIRFDSPAAGPWWDPISGYVGEEAADRAARLCLEEGVFIDIPAVTRSEPMGPQPVGVLPKLLDECEDSDEGALLERLNGSLGFDPREAWQNTPVALVLDYADGDIQEWDPTDNDKVLLNDVTVAIWTGERSRVTEPDGRLGTDPITGAGVYDAGFDMSLATAKQAFEHASYRVAAGTVDEMRYPSVTISLVDRPSLIPGWLACDLGSRIQIINQPAHLVGFDDADLILLGYEETLDAVTWKVTLNLAPSRIHRPSALAPSTDPPTGRLVSTTCTLHSDVDDDDTSWQIDSTPLFVTSGGQFPQDVLIDGERVTVSNCSGSSSPQTWTVVRSVNGVVKSHDAGARIRLANPFLLAL